MNKAELIGEIADEYFEGNKAVAGRALNAVLDTITKGLIADDKVTITGFGIFEKLHKDERTVRNPKTGARKQVPAETVPRFRPGSDLKNSVSGAAITPTVAKREKRRDDDRKAGRKLVTR
jgi:DNA-binding protein HU-beta